MVLPRRHWYFALVHVSDLTLRVQHDHAARDANGQPAKTRYEYTQSQLSVISHLKKLTYA